MDWAIAYKDACKDEGWLKIPSTRLYRCRCYFESANCTQFFYENDSFQHAKKVVSDSPGLVDFAIGQELVNPVLNLPEGKVKFFGKFKLQKNRNQGCSSIVFLGYLKDSPNCKP